MTKSKVVSKASKVKDNETKAKELGVTLTPSAAKDPDIAAAFLKALEPKKK